MGFEEEREQGRLGRNIIRDWTGERSPTGRERLYESLKNLESEGRGDEDNFSIVIDVGIYDKKGKFLRSVHHSVDGTPKELRKKIKEFFDQNGHRGEKVRIIGWMIKDYSGADASLNGATIIARHPKNYEG